MKHLIFACASLAAIAAAAQTAAPAQKDLRAFYRDNCARCHGIDGAARAADGKGLRGQDFTDENWRAGTTDEKMAKVILKGKFFGLAMPGYSKQLSKEEALRFAAEVLRAAVKGAPIAPGPGQPKQ